MDNMSEDAKNLNVVCKGLIRHAITVVGCLDKVRTFNIKLTTKVFTPTTFIERTHILPPITADIGLEYNPEWVEYPFHEYFNMNYNVLCKLSARVELVEVGTGTILGKVCFQTLKPFYPENLDSNGYTKKGLENV